MARIEQREPGASRSRGDGGGEGDAGHPEPRQGVTERRVLRSQYLAVKNLINDEREDLSRADSDKFRSIIREVEGLHQFVQKPREQVADAEALLDIASTLVTSVKSHTSEGVTPSDFVTSLLKLYGIQQGMTSGESNSISWAHFGINTASVFRAAPGCCTMFAVNTEIKQRKAVAQRKRSRPNEISRPEQVDDTASEEKTDTDKNMAAMFEILRKKKSVKLEALVLNRTSFAQTVENIFALSFLVKDGRAEITVKDNGQHLVSPRNAPAANAVASRDVTYNHFVFRLDFKDWKLMMDSVGVGEELMPPRNTCISDGSHTTMPTTPIRKLSRNRGRVVQDESIVDDTPETDNVKRKRLFR